MNLFKPFEDTTGGTSGIDIEAAVADLRNEAKEDDMEPNQDSALRPTNDEYYDE